MSNVKQCYKNITTQESKETTENQNEGKIKFVVCFAFLMCKTPNVKVNIISLSKMC